MRGQADWSLFGSASACAWQALHNGKPLDKSVEVQHLMRAACLTIAVSLIDTFREEARLCLMWLQLHAWPGREEVHGEAW